MEEEVLVYVDLDGEPRLAGRLWARRRKGRESATFEYDPSWLEYENRFSLEPALAVGPGPFHTAADRAMFGAIGDSAPDRWGRVLMRRAERRRALHDERTPRALREIDYLLRVDDEARLGALRFRTKRDEAFLADHGQKIPPLIELPQLLSAADHAADEGGTDEELRLLLAPGSSLGGARPKASVRDADGGLAIAKFPNRNDEIDAVKWEALALRLAENAGIEVPRRRVEVVADRPVLILRRFDRDGAVRVPFLSAMSLLGARDNETRSYLEIADVIRKHGAAARADLKKLWKRIVFNVLISNTDDHLRNHGFLYGGPAGWRLSPAYDLNPVPLDLKPRVLSTTIDLDDSTASLELASSVAEYFGLKPKEAEAIIGEVRATTGTWREEAQRLGIGRGEIDRMASAFWE